MIKDILYGTTQTFYSIVKHNTWVKKKHTHSVFIWLPYWTNRWQIGSIHNRGYRKNNTWSRRLKHFRREWAWTCGSGDVDHL
jgi:hypothetical protein